MRFLPILAAAILLLAAPAAAHGAPAVLDVETLLIEDEAEELFFAFDGYDITSLYVREAFWEPLGESGLVFRVNLFGGAGVLPTGGENLIRIGLSAGDEIHEVALSTSDDATWTSDFEIVDQLIEPDEFAPSAVVAMLQVFVPYSALNVTIGDTISDFWIESQSGGSVVDTSPGGWNLPVVGLPSPTTLLTGEGEIITASLELAGPAGYTESRPYINGQTVHIDINNTITTAGQHVFVRVPGGTGWDVQITGDPGKSLEPGTDFHTMVEVKAMSSAPQPIHIVSDLGGLETFYLVDDDGLRLSDGSDLSPADHGDDHESPGIGLLVLGAALAALAIGRRR